ncbi:Tkl protein kinase, partial [Globisporangium splendens]
MNEENEHFGSHRVSTATRVHAREPPAEWFLSLDNVIVDEDEGYLGEGSLGPVYRGTWMETAVAVKLMGDDQELDPIHRSLFVREVTIWYRLRHPHILTLFGACHIDTRYFVSEYASYGTMREYLAQRNDDQLAWKMLYELSLAVQYLHSRNIIHNDLRCDNVLVGGDGKAKLTGFGLASIINEEIVIDPNQIREAERWRKSPEYVASGKASFESDIYSLGMCILEVLIGDASRRPHAAEDSVLFQVGKDQIPNRKRLMRYEMLITKQQWQLVRKMTAEIPSQRAHISQITLELAQIVRQAFTAKSSNGVDNSKLESPVLVTPEQTATEVSCKSLAPQSHTSTTADRARTTLSYAAESGDWKMCAFLIERGASVDLCDAGGRDPLSYAAANGHTKSVMLLMNLGADANKKDKDGRSPLWYAVNAAKSETVQLLVDRGADETEKDLFRRNPLLYAAHVGDSELVQLLVDRGADVTEKNKYGRSPLSYAVEAGKTEIVQLLVDLGAVVTEYDLFGRSPLSYAAKSGKTEIVRIFVDRGADVTEKDECERSLLSYAAEGGKTAIVQLLVDLGADVTEKDSLEEVFCPDVTEKDKMEEVLCLCVVDRGADVAEKDKNGRSPLSYAAEGGKTETVQLLVDRGADVTEKDEYGRSPLSYAAEAGKREIVQLLVDRGAGVTEKSMYGRSPLSCLVDLGAVVTEYDLFGRSPLSYATKSGKTEIVQLLVDYGADVTEKDKNERSPLSYAAKEGKTEIVQLLVDYGADVTEKDKNERSPLSYAAEAGKTETVQLLVDLGAVVTEYDLFGRSPLSYAAKSGKTEIVQLLVDYGADVTEKDKNGRNLLSYAAESGYSGVTTMLIKEGSAVDEKDSNGRTALSYAAQQGHSEIVSSLLKAGASPNGTIVWNESQSECETSLTLAGRAGHMNIVKTLIEAGADVDVRAPDGETPLISISRWDYTPGVQLLIEKCRSGVNPFATRSTARTPLLPVMTTRVMQRLQDVCSQLEQQGTNKEAVDAIEDVKNRFLRVCGMEEPSVPDWFISREDVEFNEWNRTGEDAETTSYEGKWLKTKVIVATSQQMDKNEFQKVADRWYSLSHPNVRKLFGACHIESKPFFVYEYGKRLLDVLIEKQQSPWKYLYDAALGVQLLHQRSIVHGDLRCSNIVVGLDGVAKVGGLEYRMDHYYFWFDTEQAGWASPELLSGQVKSLSSDIYAFGMCILEAITLKRPWFPLELYGYYRNVRRRKLPDRPESFSDDQWDLVTKMCAYKSADRISIGYVVLQFKKFVETRNYLVLVAHDTHIEFPQLELNTIPVKLQTIRDRCQQLPESKWLVRDVWPALEFLFHTMVSQQIRPTDTVAEKYCAALRSLDRYLRTTLSEKSTAHAARSRQVAESHHVIYEELDRLLDMVHVSKSHPIRSWKRSEASIDQRILKDANCVKASAIPGAVSLKMFGLSRTELCDGRTGDEPQAVPTWFLPLRKLQFSSSSEIGQGAFGKVYKGVWLDTPVVVKFMGYEGDRDTISNELFLHEVRVWHRLKKHPHIVELYGACHVDKRYFVCEYASNGDLREYLKRAGNDHLVWDKLYEIALGLAYMHGLSVVHNDLRCDNVLVGGDGKAKLTGFGLASIINEEIVIDPNQIREAERWRKSPEYVASGKASFESDIYSLGMCILEVLIGDASRRPHAAEDSVLFQVGKDQIPNRKRLMRYEMLITKQQWQLVRKMTAEIPSQRAHISQITLELAQIVRQAFTAKSSNGVDNSKLESPVLVTPEQTATEVSCKSLAPQSHTSTTADRARTTLSYAAESGDWKMCAFLIERGASVDLCDAGGRDPLSYAAANGHIKAVVLLMNWGADIGEKDEYGRSPLSYAAEAGKTETVLLLVDLGAVVTEYDLFGRSPLSYAAKSGKTEIVRHLVDYGADVTEKDKNERSPLSYAAEAGKTEIKSFVDAAEAGKTETVQLLVDLGAVVTEYDLFGRSPLSYAAKSGKTEIVQLLVDYGADVTEKDKNERSPLSYAAEAGKTETVQLLVDLGAVVTEYDLFGRSPLSYAAKSGKTEIVQLLVDYGADVTEKDKNGRNLLSYAAESGYSGVTTMLIKEGSAVDEKDSNGRTALSYAAQQGHSEIVSSLLKAGASPNGTIVWNESQSECETSLTLAGRAGHMNIVKTLIEAGADVDVRAPDGETPLISISRWDYTPGVQLLIEKCRSGVNPFATRSTARTPLLPGTLETMHGLCTKTHEFAVMTTRVMQRLQDVCSQLEQQGTNKEAVDAIEDVKNRFLRVCGMEEPSVPDWFISREDVEFNEWNRTGGDAEITTYEGKWLKTKKVADRWYSLSHPNVRKLFGACHIESKPFFVYEYGKRLLDVLIEKQQSPWKYLYDAALGVQLLHQRSIVHGDLRCSNIVVGLDGVAKVGGLEYRMDHYYFWFDTEQAGWASPELLSGQVKSLSSDIYAFGMCILEAITLKRPWFPLELYGYYRNVRRRKLPDRPESFSDDQWDLVTKMCAYKSADRISIGYVVLQFKKFVETRNYLVLVAHDTHIEFPQLELNTIPVKLQTIRDRCQQLPESKWLVRDVWPALEFLFHTMVSQQIRPTDTVAEKYCAALRSLDRYLRTTLSEKSTAHAARSRQVAESHHVIYEELDRLLDMVHVSKSHPIRSWKRSEASIDQRILKDANCVKASAIPGAVSLKMFGLSRTELCDGRTGDEPQAVPTWFLPLRKLQFSSSSEIGQGAFGKVYKGVWLDTPVVVKFMGYEGDRDTISNELFLHEVRVWHRLKKHPHIVELYGACHVDKRYFVCEYASNGDLREYLKRAGNDHLVWDKLYEIALGLAYMHGLSVVHNDLRCDNVLVGGDGKAKLTGFGLASIINEAEIVIDPNHIREAERWRKSPEYVASGKASFESDIYSLGMCILEMHLGPDIFATLTVDDIRDQVKINVQSLTDDQWQLVWAMTSADPLERATLSYVIDRMCQINNERITEAQSTTANYSGIQDPIAFAGETRGQDDGDVSLLDHLSALKLDLDDARDEHALDFTSQWDNFLAPEAVVMNSSSSSATNREDNVRGPPEMNRPPVWLFSCDEVDLDKGTNETIEPRTTYIGKWMKTSVMVTSTNLKWKEFEQRVSRWYSFSHPHVVVLYGALCIDNSLLFVHEYSPNRTMSEFSHDKKNHENNRCSIWKKLHEASLGLQYLHQRNTVHGNLRLRSLTIGSDSKVKIGGFDQCRSLSDDSNQYCSEHVGFTCTQAESFASDIYAFGICISDALTPENTESGYANNFQSNRPPVRSENMHDAHWSLIEKMCDSDPTKRVNIAYVVNQLERFADEQYSYGNSSSMVERVTLEEYTIPGLETTIPKSLAYTKKRCLATPGSQWITEKNVYWALQYIFERFGELRVCPREIEVFKFGKLLSRIEQYLKTSSSANSIAHAKRSLTVAEVHHVIYSQLEFVVEILNQPKPREFEIWERRKIDVVMNLLQDVPATLVAVPKHIEPVSLTLYDTSTPTSPAVRNYSWSHERCLSDSTTPPPWYLPLMEVEFSQQDYNCVGEGSFAKVYRGKWMDTPVVVKFAGYEEDTDAIVNKLFLHEVHILHQLNHPHIVKLYGANHIRKRYMILEYAPYGHLNDYLRRAENRGSTWQKIYEVALGIEYLHELNIVHNDLKCNNIMIGADGKAKLIDFGLSSIPNATEIMVHADAIGAVRWRSPEYLQGERPSLASDIYSFAMCILEAVTGDIPWGCNMVDAVVKFNVKKGKIPVRPESMTDKQWKLIEMMTTSDPSKRVKIREVVEKLEEIIKS